MVQINFALKEVNCKIVYYGPGMSGKTTNLEVVHKKAPTANKGELTSIATEGDRTLFFDFMPLDLGNIAGMRTKFQLYTVPGQVYYNSTRKLVLQGVDGIIFVADSQEGKMEENLESLENLRNNLAEYGKSLDEIPMVIQYNKRDLPNVMDSAYMDEKLNPRGLPHFDGVATTGEGVFPTLKALSSMVLESLSKEKRGAGVAPRRRPAPVAEEPARETVAAAARPAPSAPSAPAPAPAPVQPEEEPNEVRRKIEAAKARATAPADAAETRRPAGRLMNPEPEADRAEAPSRSGGGGARIRKGTDGFFTAPPTGPAPEENEPTERDLRPEPEPAPAARPERRSGSPARPASAEEPAERRPSRPARTAPSESAPRTRRSAPSEPMVQRFVLEDERSGSPVVLIVLGLIVVAAVGVILYSFQII